MFLDKQTCIIWYTIFIAGDNFASGENNLTDGQNNRDQTKGILYKVNVGLSQSLCKYLSKYRCIIFCAAPNLEKKPGTKSICICSTKYIDAKHCKWQAVYIWTHLNDIKSLWLLYLFWKNYWMQIWWIALQTLLSCFFFIFKLIWVLVIPFYCRQKIGVCGKPACKPSKWRRSWQR